jgi:hypothetical protein
MVVWAHGPRINCLPGRVHALPSPVCILYPKPSLNTSIQNFELKMALLVDKLRPRTLDALSYHPELSDRLRSLVRDSIP